LIVAISRWVVVITAFSGSHFQASGFAGGMVTSKTAMGVNGGLYPDLAKKDTTPNKLHRWKDIPACP